MGLRQEAQDRFEDENYRTLICLGVSSPVDKLDIDGKPYWVREIIADATLMDKAEEILTQKMLEEERQNKPEKVVKKGGYMVCGRTFEEQYFDTLDDAYDYADDLSSSVLKYDGEVTVLEREGNEWVVRERY